MQMYADMEIRLPLLAEHPRPTRQIAQNFSFCDEMKLRHYSRRGKILWLGGRRER